MAPIALSFSIEPTKGRNMVLLVFRERHASGDPLFAERKRNTLQGLKKTLPNARMLPCGPLEYAFSIVVTRTQAADMVVSEMLSSSSLGQTTISDLFTILAERAIQP